MSKKLIAAVLGAAGLLGEVRLEARPAENVTVKVPFTFTAANRVLPPGAYKIEFLTKGEPGVDELEVITLRGLDTGSYTSFVARLGRADAASPVMSFLEEGGANMLAEVRANGRSLVIRDDQGGDTQADSPRMQTVSDSAKSPGPAALKEK